MVEGHWQCKKHKGKCRDGKREFDYCDSERIVGALQEYKITPKTLKLVEWVKE